ncbi:hypothetical protein GQ53DRAFT_699579 [Thozetella sp. PMI_491]|nr:hypothetical protein GQ53DRAFT_699579 [Thozetella sp. PMI_491]
MIEALSPTERDSLASSAIEFLDTLPPDIQHSVRYAYAHGLRMVFISFTAISGLCIITSPLIKELAFRKDSPELQAEMEANKTSKKEGAAEESAIVGSRKDAGDESSVKQTAPDINRDKQSVGH